MHAARACSHVHTGRETRGDRRTSQADPFGRSDSGAEKRDGGQDEDGWITVSIPEVPGVLNQGRTREEAREILLSALNDWLRFYVEDHGDEDAGRIPVDADTELLQLSFAA